MENEDRAIPDQLLQALLRGEEEAPELVGRADVDGTLDVATGVLIIKTTVDHYEVW